MGIVQGTLAMPVRAKPYKHQQEAFDFCSRVFGLLRDGGVSPPEGSRGAALLMEMGCGKTLVSIATAGALYQADKIRRVLVVAPLSLLGNWEDEFQRFSDYPVSVTVLKGTMEKKRDALKKAAASSGGVKPLAVAIVNYESAWRMEEELLSFAPDLIIADEGHKIKEGRTSQSKCLHHLGDRAGYRLLLTGTVITNKEIDVWSQYRFVDPGIFGKSFFAFRNRFFDMTGYGLHTPVFREAYREEFLERLHHVAFRVTKEEALDLPETTEEVRYVELEPKAGRLYADLARESYAELESCGVSAVNILTKILRLSQLTGGHVGDDEGRAHLVSTAKLDAFADILDSAMEEGKKLVVMARFVPELDDIAALLEKRHIGYAQVRGGVRDRTGEVRRFQEDGDCRVFLGQIAAAGLGITLTASDVMVFYSMDYSMSNFTQAQARIHRIGQKNTCHYLYLVAKGTIDERVLMALRGKMDLARMLVDDYRKGLAPF